MTNWTNCQIVFNLLINAIHSKYHVFGDESIVEAIIVILYLFFFFWRQRLPIIKYMCIKNFAYLKTCKTSVPSCCIDFYEQGMCGYIHLLNNFLHIFFHSNNKNFWYQWNTIVYLQCFYLPFMKFKIKEQNTFLFKTYVIHWLKLLELTVLSLNI